MPPRQEVLNVLLAQLLQERGLVAAPEQILRGATGQSVSLPDVVVDFRGLRLVIEAEFADGTRAETAAYDKAPDRVEQGIAHLGVAVVYPRVLRRGAPNINQLRQALAQAALRFSIVTESTVIARQIQLFGTSRDRAGFVEGNLEHLAESLGRSYEQLVEDEVLERAVALLDGSILQFIGALGLQPATAERFADALDIRELPRARTSHERVEQRNAMGRIAALILINAMIFQEVLSQTNRRVFPLQWFRVRPSIIGNLAKHWRFILRRINYYPIFDIAFRLLGTIAADRGITSAVESLVDSALQIVGWRAPLRHDLAGRVYHRLLSGAKFLGAYYTSIPTATLLMKLALDPDRWSQDWSDLDAIREFRIADLACGTGTLLMAAADVVADNHVRRCVELGEDPELGQLQEELVAHSIIGFDVLESAVHLTASTLALRIPDRPINVTNLSKLPFGGVDRRMGSIDFVESSAIQASVFSLPQRVAGRGHDRERTAELPELDLCAMNPPFTSSRQPNLLFGTIPDGERQQMQQKLQQIVRRNNLQASITAGLGAVFVALADRYLRPEGRLALVLPRSLLAGVAWSRTRELLGHSYELETLIVSHEAHHWNFSENTDLSEVLVIARKNGATEGGATETVCVNLWHQPRNTVEALSLARSLLTCHAPSLTTGQGTAQIAVGDVKFGEAVSIPWDELKAEPWTVPCAFAQSDLVRALYHLRKGGLRLPGLEQPHAIELTPLRDLGDLGPDPRDVYDGFDNTATSTAYRALWGHDVDQVNKLRARTNSYLSPLSQPKRGRPLRRATDLWPRAGRVMIAMRPRLNTKKVMAVRLAEKALGDVWWPFSLHSRDRGLEEAEKALVVWLNSTLGLLMMLGVREETEGPWVQFKKPVLGAIPVLDVWRIGNRRRTVLAALFDSLADRALMPFPEMANDPVRAELDGGIARTLRLPDFSILRQLLAGEPIISVSMSQLEASDEEDS